MGIRWFRGAEALRNFLTERARRPLGSRGGDGDKRVLEDAARRADAFRQRFERFLLRCRRRVVAAPGRNRLVTAARLAGDPVLRKFGSKRFHECVVVGHASAIKQAPCHQARAAAISPRDAGFPL